MSSLFGDDDSDTASTLARLRAVRLQRDSDSVNLSGRSPPLSSSGTGSQPPRRAHPTLGRSTRDAPVNRPRAPSGRSMGGGGLDGKSTRVPIVPVYLFTLGTCGGTVGADGNKMCARDADPASGRCQYRTHKTKHPHHEDCVGYYYIGSGPNSVDVLSDYRIYAEDCTDEMLDILNGDRRPIDEWITTFEEFNIQIEERKARARVKVEEVSMGLDGELDDVENPDVSIEEFSPLELGTPPTAPEFGDDDAANAKSGIEAILSLFESFKNIHEVFDELNDKLSDENQDKRVIADKMYELIGVQANLSRAMGDRKFIEESYGSVADALYRLFDESEAQKLVRAQLNANLNEVEDRIDEKFEEVKDEYRMELERLKTEMEDQKQKQQQPMDDQSIQNLMIDPVTGLVDSNMPFSPVDGVSPTIAWLVRRQIALEAKVKELQNMIESSGGFKAASRSFNSLQEVKDLIRKEHPSGSNLALFTAFNSLAAHDVYLSPKEEMAYHSVNKDLTSTDALVINSVITSMFPLYTGTAKSYSGGLLDCFKNGDDTWSGDGDGRKNSIERKLDMCEEKVKKAAEQHLQHAPTLKNMSSEFASKTNKFLVKLHNHFAADLKILAALKLPESDIFQLFSDVFQNIAEEMQAEFVGIQGVSVKVDPVDRLAELIWATGKAHMRMDDYIEKKFKHHEIVQSAFVRFLTKKTGQNSSASLGAKMAKLEKEVKAAVQTGSDAKRLATDAVNKSKQTADQLEQFKKKGK